LTRSPHRALDVPPPDVISHGGGEALTNQPLPLCCAGANPVYFTKKTIDGLICFMLGTLTFRKVEEQVSGIRSFFTKIIKGTGFKCDITIYRYGN